MDVIGQHLEEREGVQDGNARGLAALDQRKADEAWLITGQSPEVRLLAFDGWVRRELAKRLDWAWAGTQKEKRIEQCRGVLEKMVVALWRRGWWLDGVRLARRIEGLLDAVGKYQRAGKVDDFWAYFGAAVRRYVGSNAEEIQTEAMRAGANMANVVEIILARGRAQASAQPTLPELMAQRTAEVHKAKEVTLREKLARARAREKSDADQSELL